MNEARCYNCDREWSPDAEPTTQGVPVNCPDCGTTIHWHACAFCGQEMDREAYLDHLDRDHEWLPFPGEQEIEAIEGAGGHGHDAEQSISTDGDVHIHIHQ